MTKRTKPKRVRAQAKKDKIALRKLVRAGLYTGKFDARKKITKSQRATIRKYADVVTGKATVIKPENPASYKNLFRVKGDKVIVPRRKGEKIKVTKTGKIVGERKVGKRTVRSYFRRVERGAEIPKQSGVMYALPFIRGRDANGKPILDWKRFPTMGMLKSFMEGYDYKDWTDYVLEERVDPEHAYTVTEAQKKHRAKRATKKRRDHKFSRFVDDEDEE